MTFTLKIVKQFFCTIHRLMIIHHDTKFGKKWLHSSGEIERTDTWTELQMDKVVPIYPQKYVLGGGGIKSREYCYSKWHNTCKCWMKMISVDIIYDSLQSVIKPPLQHKMVRGHLTKFTVSIMGRPLLTVNHVKHNLNSVHSSFVLKPWNS